MSTHPLVLLPKRRPGGRSPLWQQRKRAADLLGVASKYGSFPMLLEAYRECLRDVFDVPDLATMNDDIVNGDGFHYPDGSIPLAPFTAQRVDYSLARLSHYTATDPEHFQNHVLFTNYQFYVEEFEAYARQQLAHPESGYTALVGPGNSEITEPETPLPLPGKLPQMPTFHPKRADGQGIRPAAAPMARSPRRPGCPGGR